MRDLGTYSTDTTERPWLVQFSCVEAIFDEGVLMLNSTIWKTPPEAGKLPTTPVQREDLAVIVDGAMGKYK